MMQKILVSACLLGQPVRYDGAAVAVADPRLTRWRAEGRLVSLCPELAAGFAVPRAPAEIVGAGSHGDGGAVLDGLATVSDAAGEDLSRAYRDGAEVALRLARQHRCRIAVLTENSPSCGSAMIYDGSFNGRKRPGDGVTTALLRRHGIQVFSQHDLARAERALRELE